MPLAAVSWLALAPGSAAGPGEATGGTSVFAPLSTHADEIRDRRRGVARLVRGGEVPDSRGGAGKPEYLRVYASFDTPYGGVESAAGAVKRGTQLVPSWIDVAAGSPFLDRMHATLLPEDLPFYLFFGWGLHGHHGPAPAGDGTITLASQLDPRAQAVATGMSGYAQTHVGILSDKAALEELSSILDAACDRGAGK